MRPEDYPNELGATARGVIGRVARVALAPLALARAVVDRIRDRDRNRWRACTGRGFAYDATVVSSHRLAVRAGATTAAEPSRGTLDAFADAVVERARPHLCPARDLDVAVAVAGSWPRLGDDLAALVIARLRALGLRSVARGDGDAAWARAAGYERLLRLDLDVGGGRLRASGSVVALTSSPWTAPSELRAHLYVETPLDAELRAYLPAVATPPGRWQARGMPVGDVDVLALDVGDVDGDGRAEVVGATADRGDRLGLGRRAPGRAAALAARRPAGGDDAARAGGHGGRRATAPSPRARRSSPTACTRRARGKRRCPRAAGPSPASALSCELAPGVDLFAAAGCTPAAGLPERFWTAAGLRGGARRGADRRSIPRARCGSRSAPPRWRRRCR